MYAEIIKNEGEKCFKNNKNQKQKIKVKYVNNGQLSPTIKCPTLSNNINLIDAKC